MSHSATPTPLSPFQRPLFVALFALTAATLWGFAYPLIKLGFAEFAISPDMTGSKMLFAGIRFFISGGVVLTMAQLTHRPMGVKQRSNWGFLLIFSLLNTTLHYAFFYFGLSHSAGARAAILNSLSVFSVVLLACLFFGSDHLTPRKVIGCLVGFTGILLLNVGGEAQGSFTWLGDGMIILNALCGASASLLTRRLSKCIDVFVGTGYSLAIGGALLLLSGLALDGTLPRITPWGLLWLALLVCISTVGFVLYNKLLTCNPVGKVAIFNSLIPVVGAVSSCLCLQEPFYWKYLWAGALATLGIYLINKGK